MAPPALLIPSLHLLSPSRQGSAVVRERLQPASERARPPADPNAQPSPAAQGAPPRPMPGRLFFAL